MRDALENPSSGSFLLTATGMTTSPTGTAKFARSGNLVVLHIPSITGTSNTTALTLTGLPKALRPVATRKSMAIRYDNGVLAHFPIDIGTDGVITYYSSFTSATGFTGSGTKGPLNTQVAYVI